MTQITAQSGDTPERISRRVYGSTQGAGRIRAANPGLQEPIQSGTLIYAPPGPQQGARQPLPAQSVDEVALLIAGQRFRFWEAMSITRAIDAPDTVEFSSPFNSDDPDFRETFRPFRYPSCTVTVGGEPLTNGIMLTPQPTIGESSVTVDVSAYATPGLLQDVSPPSSAWPVEYEGLNLRQIAETVCDPFGVGVVFEADPGPAFGRVSSWDWSTDLTMDASQTVWAFLEELAKQRNLVMGTDTAGNLVFRQSVAPGNPVARLEQGVPPLTSISPTFGSQEYCTHVTAIMPASTFSEGAQYTAVSPFRGDALRPHIFEVSDAEDSDVRTAAEAKLGRLLGNVAQWRATAVGWRDPNGRLWEPNTTITLKAPGAMIYEETEFLVREVTLDRDESSQTATLHLVLPGAMSGEMPDRLPWDVE